MPEDLRVVVANRPGTALRCMEALAEAGINIQAFCGDIRPGERWGYLHFLVEDGKRAQEVIEAAGVEVTSRNRVEIIKIKDEVGALAKAVKQFADSGQNLQILYQAGEASFAFATEDMMEERTGVRVKDAR